MGRSLKYECIYMNAFVANSDARACIGKWLTYYNAERPHSTHGIYTDIKALGSMTLFRPRVIRVCIVAH